MKRSGARSAPGGILDFDSLAKAESLRELPLKREARCCGGGVGGGGGGGHILVVLWRVRFFCPRGDAQLVVLRRVRIPIKYILTTQE